MKDWIAVVSSTNNKVTKYQDFDTEDEAKAHIATHGGFVDESPSDLAEYWTVDAKKKTLTADNSSLASDVLADKWTSIRSKRDKLMAESDWRSMPDSPTMSSAWKTYRKALRDLPASESDPDDITWPDAPS
jgi:hypothetical protein